MTAWQHEIQYAIGSANDWRWFPEVTEYAIASDLLTPADGLSLTVPWTADAHRLCRGDAEIQIWIDRQRVFSGVIDGRTRTVNRDDGATITLTARDKVGRFLLDDAAPLIAFRGLGLVDLAKKLCGDRLVVTTSNANNRRLIAGPLSKRVSREPPIATGKNVHRKVEPGDTRWQVLHYFLEEAGLLAWATADGQGLVIGTPNYAQPAQWQWVLGGPGAAWGDSTVMTFSDTESLGERYSQVQVLGTKAGVGADARTERGVARNGKGTAGTGKDFRFPKRMVLRDDRGDRHRQQMAEREMAERDGAGRDMRITVPGHGQARDGAQVIYTYDTIGELDDRELASTASWYVVGVGYRGSKREGQVTDLRLVPIGTLLRMG